MPLANTVARYLPCCAATCAVAGKDLRFLSMPRKRSLNSCRSSSMFPSMSTCWSCSSIAEAPFDAVLDETRAVTKLPAALRTSAAREKTPCTARRTSSGSSSLVFVLKYSAYSSSCGYMSAFLWKSSFISFTHKLPPPSASPSAKSSSATFVTRFTCTVAASPKAKIVPQLPFTWRCSSATMPCLFSCNVSRSSSGLSAFISRIDFFTCSDRLFCLMPVHQTMQP
mmetsp:Transcript_25644/g.77190  ORF Transcript_25644/g.77190 Transcript_25644/m.77190 type:complete len:225 (+) Transcript_25644:317-991(+)